MRVGNEDILIPTMMVGNYPKPRWYVGQGFANVPLGNFIGDSVSFEAFEDCIAALVLEQELVRAEAQNLVAEAQLTNITRQKLKEAYEAEFTATIERAEKQIILARHGRRLLNLLDDTPVVPGDVRTPYTEGGQARQILNDADDDLKDWQPELESYETPVETHAKGKGGFVEGETFPAQSVTKTGGSEVAPSAATAEASV